MKQMKFGKLLVIWFAAAVVLLTVNGLFLKNVWFAHGIMASLGILLWIYPVYPESLEQWYESQICRRIIRATATAEIVLSFCIRMNY